MNPRHSVSHLMTPDIEVCGMLPSGHVYGLYFFFLTERLDILVTRTKKDPISYYCFSTAYLSGEPILNKRNNRRIILPALLFKSSN